jgi:hypothetical protein
MLQVPNAAVHELVGIRGDTCREIGPLDERDGQAT